MDEGIISDATRDFNGAASVVDDGIITVTCIDEAVTAIQSDDITVCARVDLVECSCHGYVVSAGAADHNTLSAEQVGNGVVVRQVPQWQFHLNFICDRGARSSRKTAD